MSNNNHNENYRRLEALFSEIAPLQAEPAPASLSAAPELAALRAQVRELETLRARVTELESVLAGPLQQAAPERQEEQVTKTGPAAEPPATIAETLPPIAPDEHERQPETTADPAPVTRVGDKLTTAPGNNRLSSTLKRLGRLTYPQKFILISLVFFLPLLSFGPLISEELARIDHYGRKELRGAQFIFLPYHILTDLRGHELLIQEYKAGESSQAEVAAWEADLDGDFRGLRELQRRYGAELQLGGEVEALYVDWQALKADAPTLPEEEQDARYDKLAADVRALITRVGDTSYLILDPDLDTYYMMDTVLLKLPEIGVLFDQTRDLAREIARQQAVTPEERLILNGLVERLNATVLSMNQNLEAALRNNRSGAMRPLVEAQIAPFNLAAQRYLDFLDREIIQAATLDFEAAELQAVEGEWSAADNALFAAASQALQTGIQTRINAQTNRLIFVGIFAVVAMLAASIIGLFVMRGISRPLIDLFEAAGRLAAGDMTTRVRVTNEDEVGRVAGAFNGMVEALRTNRASLETRNRDLTLAAEVGQRLSQTLEVNALLTEAVGLIRARFDLYYAQVYLTDDAGRSLILRAGTGPVGQELLQRGFHLPMDHNSLNGTAALNQQTVIVADTASAPNFRPNPLLLDTRSEMCVPLIAGERVAGVLDLQSARPGAFSEENLPAFQALAGQLAVAVQNAALLTQAQASQAELEARARRLARGGWENFLNAIERSERLGYAYDLNAVTLLAETPPETMDGKMALALPIAVAGEPIGRLWLEGEADQPLTEEETELISAVAQQVAQQVENLRLLAQAEQGRAEVEAQARRLTREGWQDYLQRDAAPDQGYVYDLNQVAPLAAGTNGNGASALTWPLTVQGETIGELAVDEFPERLSDEAAELATAVSEHLSAHIENLRLTGQTRTALTQVEQQATELRALFAAMPDVVLVYDEHGRYLKIAPTNPSLLYKPPEDMLDKTVAEVLPAPQAEAILGHIRRVLQTREVLDIEYPLSIGGQEIWFSATVSPLTANTVFWIARDITARKRAENALTKHAVELETVARVSTAASTILDADKLLQDIVNLTKASFGLYHTHIYLTNEAGNTLILAAGAGEVGRHMVAQGWQIPVEQSRATGLLRPHKSLVARAARERRGVIVNNVREAPDFLPNPLLPNTCSEMAVPLIVGDKVLGVFDVQSDVVDRFTDDDLRINMTLAGQVAVALQNARLYAEQTATVTRLRELDQLKSSFLANMSHELRTPLNSILGFAEVMLEGIDGDLTDRMDNDLKVIYKNGQHLLTLINDILDMAKIEAGKMSLTIERFNLQEVLEEAVGITAPLAQNKSLELRLETNSADCLDVEADRIRLRQVMINLVNNAIKFTEAGSVTINAVKTDHRLLVAVRDTGVGIPVNQLETIFQEFHQVDSSTTRKASGTGLGLPISRHLIELHHGRLWAESSGLSGPDSGSTFYVELPVHSEYNPDVKRK
jgi:PAS domain S-box-containing protein